MLHDIKELHGTETSQWYSGKEILIAPGRVAQIRYEGAKMFVNFTDASVAHTAENAVPKEAA